MPTTEPSTGVWQGLDLEKDILLEILGRLSTSDKVKLCSVSRSWMDTVEACCNLWQQTTVTAAQASSSQLERWIYTRRKSVMSYTVEPQLVQSSPDAVLAAPIQRPYLTDMAVLQAYYDFSNNARLSSLENLPSTLQQLEAHVVLPSETLPWRNPGDLHDVNCIVDVEQLTQLANIKIHATASLGRSPMLMVLRLPDTHTVSLMSVTISPETWVTIHWSGGFQGLRHLSLSSICSQAQVDAIVQCTNLEKLKLGIDIDNEARSLLDSVDYDYKLDVRKVRQLCKLQVLDLTLVSCYLLNAQYIQCLPSLQTLSVSMVGDRGTEVAVLFRPEGIPDMRVQFGLNKLKHVMLQMHSVFDITDCLEGLQLVGVLHSLHVILTHSSTRNPSEAHWAIKEGSVLARAVSLQHLKVECTSMLLKCLPPQLCSLHICARKINVQSHLRLALSKLDKCVLDANHVEYL